MKKVILCLVLFFATGTSFLNANDSNNLKISQDYNVVIEPFTCREFADKILKEAQEEGDTFDEAWDKAMGALYVCHLLDQYPILF